LERLEKTKADHLIVATSTEIQDDPIEAFCRKENIQCFRGSLNNVSERFLQCALEYNLDYAIRINGDNIFADRELINQTIDYLKDQNYDFVSNVPERTFPTGMSVELVNVSFYASQFNTIKQDPNYSEHVTLYFYDFPNLGQFKFFKNDTYPIKQNLKLALDDENDLKKITRIFSLMKKKHTAYNWKEIISFLQHEAV
jgi:spore coat polysaccharide biosynthesis protein SpsF